MKRFMNYHGSSSGVVMTGLVLIGAVAMYSWVVAPHVKYLRAVQKYEPALDEIAREKDQLKDTVLRRRKMLDEIDKQFDDLRGTLFTYVQARELAQEFGAVAEQYHCRVRTVDFSDEPLSIFDEEIGDRSIDAVEALVSVVGDYNGLMAFIKKLQGRDRKMWIHSLTMSVLDEQGGRLVCNIAMTIYVIQEKEAASK
ncbi:MAG: hypothetical protein IIC50_00155 [Planctomycetes bacterium]|nr:hypothetical protein [Planctomycetota bacterium]